MEDIKNEEIRNRVRAKKEETPVEKAGVDAEAVSKLLAKVEALEKKDVANEEKLKMLYEVADKGRVFNYESSRTEKKPFKVKLSVYNNGLIVGWRCLKDELIKHPATGATVGEEQQYELLLLDKEGQTTKVVINGYSAFSTARYTERVDAEVLSKSEDFNGNLTFNLGLSDGRTLSLDGRFVN